MSMFLRIQALLQNSSRSAANEGRKSGFAFDDERLHRCWTVATVIIANFSAANAAIKGELVKAANFLRFHDHRKIEDNRLLFRHAAIISNKT